MTDQDRIKQSCRNYANTFAYIETTRRSPIIAAGPLIVIDGYATPYRIVLRSSPRDWIVHTEVFKVSQESGLVLGTEYCFGSYLPKDGDEDGAYATLVFAHRMAALADFDAAAGWKLPPRGGRDARLAKGE